MNDMNQHKTHKGYKTPLITLLVLSLVCISLSVILNLFWPEFRLGWIFDLLAIYLIPSTIFTGLGHVRRKVNNKILKVAALSLNIVLITLFVLLNIFFVWALLNSGPVPGKQSSATTLNRNAITSVRDWQNGEGIVNFEGMTLEKLQEADPDPDLEWFAENQNIDKNNVNRVSVYISNDKVIIATRSKQKCYFSLLTSEAILSGKTLLSISTESDTCSASLAPKINEENWSRDFSEGWDY